MPRRSVVLISVVTSLAAGFAECRALAQTAAEAEDGSSYYNVLIAAGDQSVEKIERAALKGREAFEQALAEELASDGVREAASFAQTGFRSSIRAGTGHVLIVCFDRSRLAAAAVCNLESIAIQKGSNSDGGTSANFSSTLARFLSTGFASIPQEDIVQALELRHGDVATITATRDSTLSPPPVFYPKASEVFEFPGVAGFQIPVAAYGGVATKDGLAFSLLAPAFSWGVRINTENRNFTHAGFGALAAPSLLESASTGGTTDQEFEKPAFTIKRLAIGAYVDLSGIAWVGGGARLDFTSAKDHGGVFFLVLGPETLAFLMGGSKATQ